MTTKVHMIAHDPEIVVLYVDSVLCLLLIGWKIDELESKHD